MTTILNTTNKKYAVVIGINYFNTDSELRGCINDAKNLATFLKEKANYEENITLLIDDGTTPLPTKANIIQSFNNEDITFSMDQKKMEMYIDYKNSRTVFKGLDAEEFPSLIK